MMMVVIVEVAMIAVELFRPQLRMVADITFSQVSVKEDIVFV